MNEGGHPKAAVEVAARSVAACYDYSDGPCRVALGQVDRPLLAVPCASGAVLLAVNPSGQPYCG